MFVASEGSPITSGSPLWRNLTRVISILQKRIPRQTCLARDSISAAFAPQAGTPPKSYLDSLLIITIRNIKNIYIRPPHKKINHFFVFVKISTFTERKGNNYTWKKSSAGKMCVKRSHCPTSLPETCTLIKKKIKFSSFIRKFRVEQLQSLI